jgi:hypothetical protein
MPPSVACAKTARPQEIGRDRRVVMVEVEAVPPTYSQRTVNHTLTGPVCESESGGGETIYRVARCTSVVVAAVGEESLGSSSSSF